MALLGLIQECTNNSGGGTGLYLALRADVLSFTMDAVTKEYTGVTMDGATDFSLYVPEEYLLSIKPGLESKGGAHKFTTTVEIDLGKLRQTQMTALQELMDSNACGYVGIIALANDVRWVVGYDEKDTVDYKNKLKITTGAGDSKQDLMDPTNFILTLVAVQREAIHTYTGLIPIAGGSI